MSESPVYVAEKGKVRGRKPGLAGAYVITFAPVVAAVIAGTYTAIIRLTQSDAILAIGAYVPGLLCIAVAVVSVMAALRLPLAGTSRGVTVAAVLLFSLYATYYATDFASRLASRVIGLLR